MLVAAVSLIALPADAKPGHQKPKPGRPAPAGHQKPAKHKVKPAKQRVKPAKRKVRATAATKTRTRPVGRGGRPGRDLGSSPHECARRR